MLAFDALAISRLTGTVPRIGKIIHGLEHTSTTISLPKLIEAARSLITKITVQHANDAPPEPTIAHLTSPSKECWTLRPTHYRVRQIDVLAGIASQRRLPGEQLPEKRKDDLPPRGFR